MSKEDNTIVRAAIHPSIGIARIGNSKDAYFIGPEVEHPPAEAPGFYHDETGALKRQAAQFRIYGCNAQGEVVRELTAEEAEIEWTVYVANKKAAWYEFQLALDVPEAASAPPTKLRNAKEQDRGKLAIDPGSRTISGADESGSQYHFDSGEFYGTKVYLGELQTDEAGRLIFLGGRGVSASHNGKPAYTFANNNGWHDDTSDGPVTAKVKLDGAELEVDPAWVLTAPPNYGPNLLGVRSMYDLLYDVYIEEGRLPVPETVSFQRDILPLLKRQAGLQWVNYGFSPQFGWGGPWSPEDEALVEKLASKDEAWAELRLQVANSFRQFERDSYAPMPWPWIYGDAMNVPPADTPRQHIQVSPTQLRQLRFWADGDFEEGVADTPSSLKDVPTAAQPATLDRASLTHCLADAFHPGCEMTWPVRHCSMYMSPYRIRHADGPVSDDYGSELTPEEALSLNGPLYAQGPGDISRWMAVPWQADTASCRSGYYAGFGEKYDPYLPTFWPARVPNQVLTLEDYEKAIDEKLPREERIAAFNRRASWFRRLGPGSQTNQINRMMTRFPHMGIVEQMPGVTGDPDLPPVMEVESPAIDQEDEGLPAHLGMAVLVSDSVDTPNLKAFAEMAHVEEDEVIVSLPDKVRRFPQGLKK